MPDVKPPRLRGHSASHEPIGRFVHNADGTTHYEITPEKLRELIGGSYSVGFNDPEPEPDTEPLRLSLEIRGRSVVCTYAPGEEAMARAAVQAAMDYMEGA